MILIIIYCYYQLYLLFWIWFIIINIQFFLMLSNPWFRLIVEPSFQVSIRRYTVSNWQLLLCTKDGVAMQLNIIINNNIIIINKSYPNLHINQTSF